MKKGINRKRATIEKNVFELENNAEELFLSHLEKEPFPTPSTPDEESEIAVKRERRITKKVQKIEIDLHGKRLKEAIEAVDSFISELFQYRGQKFEVLFVTGKGRHSDDGHSVLPKAIHTHVQTKYRSYILKIEDAPDDVRLGSLPIRGHFKALFLIK